MVSESLLSSGELRIEVGLLCVVNMTVVVVETVTCNVSVSES